MLQYWADVKAVTRQQCDYTITGLKAVFPVALATACPIGRIRNYMQRSLDHAQAMLIIGRHGDFGLMPSMCKVYKAHRRSELLRLGLASEKKVRQRGAWGSIQLARLKTPAEVAASMAAVAAAAAAEGEMSDAAVAALAAKVAAAQAHSVAASAALRAVLEADVLAGGDPFGDEKEEEFDDEITVIPTMAAAACAAAFAEVAAEAEADQEMDMLIALSGGGQDGPTREPRPAGFSEASGLDIGREFGEAFDDDY